MKLKQISVLFLSVMLILNSISFAVENKLEEVDEDISVIMTLDEAVDYALTHNANVLDINKIAKDQKELYDDAVTTYRNWQYKVNHGGYSFENVVEYMDCWGYSLELAKLSYDSYLANKGSVENTITYNVEKLAYSIYELENSIGLLEKTVKKQETDVKVGQVKKELNMITDVELEATKSSLSSTKIQLESLKPTLTTLKTNLKNLMGFDISKELVIILPEREINVLSVEKLDEVITNSLETNSAVIAAKISYKQKEINNIIATETSFMLKDEKKDAKEEFADAELRFNNSLNTIKDGLYSLYNSVKSSESSAILAKDEYDQLKIKYNQMKVMYELGMITPNDFNAFEISLLNAKNTYEAKLNENILLNKRWEIALKVGDAMSEVAQQQQQQQQQALQQQQQAAQVQQLQQQILMLQEALKQFQVLIPQN